MQREQGLCSRLKGIDLDKNQGGGSVSSTSLKGFCRSYKNARKGLDKESLKITSCLVINISYKTVYYINFFFWRIFFFKFFADECKIITKNAKTLSITCYNI